MRRRPTMRLPLLCCWMLCAACGHPPPTPPAMTVVIPPSLRTCPEPRGPQTDGPLTQRDIALVLVDTHHAATVCRARLEKVVGLIDAAAGDRAGEETGQ